MTFPTLDPTIPTAGSALDSAVMRAQFQATYNDLAALNTTVQQAVTVGRVVNVLEYGAVGNGVTDDIIALELATAAAKATNSTLLIPAGLTGCYVSRKWYLGDMPVIRVMCYSPVLHGGASMEPIIEIGDPATVNSTRLLPSMLWAKRTNYLLWSDDPTEAMVAIRIHGLRDSSVYVVEASKCSIGLQLTGGLSAAKLCGANTLFIGRIEENKAGIDLYRASSNNNYGVNSNTFYGGNVGVSQYPAFNPNPTTERRAAIRLRAPNGGTINSNRFIGIEAQVNSSTHGHLIWFQGVKGSLYMNRVVLARFEYGTKEQVYRYETADAWRNDVSLSWAEYGTGVDDRSNYPMTNTLTVPHPTPLGFNQGYWSSGQLADGLTDYNGTNYTIAGVDGVNTTTGAFQPNVGGTVTLSDGKITLGASAAIGVRVDTRSVKDFQVVPSGSAAPRVYFKGRGAGGHLVDVRKPGTSYFAKRIRSLLLVAGGSGYTNGTFSLEFSGGGATTQAEGTATISGGAVTSLTVTFGGDEYTGQPTIALPAGAGAGSGFKAIALFRRISGEPNVELNPLTTMCSSLEQADGVRAFAPTINLMYPHSVSVDSEIESVDVIVARISTDAQLNGLEVFGLKPGALGVGTVAARGRVATTVPAALRSTYLGGELVAKLAAPTATPAGWVVQQSGTLGTLAASTASIRNTHTTAVVDTGGGFATLAPNEYVSIAGGTTRNRIVAKRAIGAVSAWAADTAVVAGNFVTNDSSKLYLCVAAGTTAASGGPTGTGTGIADGTATWDYVGAASSFDGILVLASAATGTAAAAALTLAPPGFAEMKL